MSDRSYKYMMCRGAIYNALPNIMRCEKTNTRCFIRAILRTAIVALLAVTSLATADESYFVFSIPQQSADGALTALAEQTDITVVFDYDAISRYQANELKGSYKIRKAVEHLLAGTRLQFEFNRSGHLIVTQNDDSSGDFGMGILSKKKLLASTVAFFVGGSGAGVYAQEQAVEDKESGWVLEEIVVTATKREGGLQDTSIAINVLSSEAIDKRGLVRMEDYLTTIPGASYIEVNATNKKVIFRGLSVGPQDPQAVSSVYLGDMPLSNALYTYNVNLVDMERVEVIKGPQGTLYGSSAIGGIIRNIPVRPDLQEIGGNLKFDVSAQDESDDINNSMSGVVNIPIVQDELALRVAAYRYDNAGYIDIVSSPEAEAAASASGASVIIKDDSGGNISEGGRASILWQPSDELAVSLVHGTQKDDIDGRNDVFLQEGNYEISYLNTESPESIDIDYSNLTVEYDLGWGSLLSSFSWLDSEGSLTLGLFPVVFSDPFLASFLGPIVGIDSYDTSLNSQEIRLISDLDGPWQFLSGVFFEDADLKNEHIDLWVGDPALNLLGTELLSDISTNLNYEQKAIFGEISYQFNEQWLLTLGGRYFEYDRVDTQMFFNDAPFNGEDSEEDVSKTGSTYKANLAYTPNENTLIYAQWAEGFRLGRGQSLPSADICNTDGDNLLDGTDGILTTVVEPDTTENIELGVKLSLLDNRLTVNTAVYKTDWDNLPVQIEAPAGSACGAVAGGIINNIGSASSQGVELEVSYLVESWIINLTASYTDTERTDVRAPLVEGESLVYSPRTNASLGLQYNFDVSSYPAFVRADLGYVGEYESAEQYLDYESVGNYLNANFRVGVDLAPWNVDLYSTNIFGADDVVVQSSGLDAATAVGGRVRPRTVGLSVSYDF